MAITLFTVIAVLVSTAVAQAPVPVHSGGYASDGEKTLYIRGGSTTPGDQPDQITPTNQFYSLDLTTSWSTSNPAWRSLSNPEKTIPVSVYNSLAISGGTLVEWSISPGVTVYNLVENSWSTSPYPGQGLTINNGTRIAIDPTGRAYVPSASANGTQMAQFVPGEKNTKIDLVNMPLNDDKMWGLTFYSFVWSQTRSSFLLYGGFTINNGVKLCNAQLWEYKSTTWSPVPTKGSPIARGDVSNHCMVPAYGGTKMILFGGERAIDFAVMSWIYILDVPTMTWTVGKPAPADQARRSMACAVSGDEFVAWGGYNKETMMGPAPLVYNIKTDTWTSEFRESKLNIPAIAGGAGGAVVIITVVLGFVFYKRRQRQRAAAASSSADAEKKDDAESNETTEKEGPKAVKRNGSDDDLKKDPQGFNPITAYAAGIINSDGTISKENGGADIMLDKDELSRNPQVFMQSASSRNPQYYSGGYLPMHQNNPQYFEPGTQFQDMHYVSTAGNPQLYVSPYPGVSQGQEFVYPPPPPLAAMRPDSRTISMMGGGGVGGGMGGMGGAPMTEEILQLQLALVKAQQEAQYQQQQQNLARFRAGQEAQLQMLQQQLGVSSPSSAAAISAPVPAITLAEPSVFGASSLSAPVPTVIGPVPPSSPGLASEAVTVVVGESPSKVASDPGFIPDTSSSVSAPVVTVPTPSSSS
ncbi:hypothetical protein BGX23_011673 [Mortierella sp. AD031]|nr:hypothetical protein BGX23_011673 [Mortierella sp. AD031]